MLKKAKAKTNVKSNGVKITSLNESKITDKKTKDKDKKSIIIAFNILAIFCIVLIGIAIPKKEMQNDTFYTIKLGQYVRQNGIDYRDHWANSDLPYMYPHWLYDVMISFIYDYMGGYFGIYVSTCVFSVILGLVLYLTNHKITKNYVISFLLTILQMYFVKDFVAARAQLVTFILFVLTIYFIEKFLEKPKVRYAVALLIIPIIIANVHSAVFPFYFILYLPYIGEYLVRVLIDAHLLHKIKKCYYKKAIKFYNKKLKKASKDKAKTYQEKLAKLETENKEEDKNFETFKVKQTDRLKKPYKLRINRNDNTKWLILIFAISIFTGLLTPLKDMPYTYTYRIMKGDTTKSISEHLPLTLINDKEALTIFAVCFIVLIFTKIKISLKNCFMFFGLLLLAFMSRRQLSMFYLFGGMCIAQMGSDLITIADKRANDLVLEYFTTIYGELVLLLIIFTLAYSLYKPNIKAEYVNEDTYPVAATEWIKNNLDYKNIKLYNDYNYGSYLMLNDIKVFIDSRCDLYTPEFNGNYDKSERKWKDGKNIFDDYMDVSSIGTYYEDTFKKYEFTHIMIKKNSKVNMLITREKNKNYKEIYSDKNFVIYERLENQDTKDLEEASKALSNQNVDLQVS